MASFYKEGNTLRFDGFKGVVTQITETYRKNVLVIKLSEPCQNAKYKGQRIDYIGLFEYPDGRLEFMSIIE